MKIKLIPYAGLGNRMRVIASVYKYAIMNSCELTIYWNKEKGLNALYYRLFKPVKGLNIKDSRLCDFFVNNYPCAYNLFIPKIVDVVFRRKSFYAIGIDKLDEIVRANASINVSTYSQQGDLYPLSELFVPTDEIMDIINSIKSRFGKTTIGVHIRRTDNKQAQNCSTVELFVKKFEELFESAPDTKIFLCTDDILVKNEIIKKFGKKRIITYDSTLNRHSFKGIRDAVVELYTLASTNKIWGSFYSSYTEMASALFGTELEIIK